MGDLFQVELSQADALAWLQRNAFCVDDLQHFSGQDLFALSKADLKAILGTAQGIRLHNCIHSAAHRSSRSTTTPIVSGRSPSKERIGEASQNVEHSRTKSRGSNSRSRKSSLTIDKSHSRGSSLSTQTKKLSQRGPPARTPPSRPLSPTRKPPSAPGRHAVPKRQTRTPTGSLHRTHHSFDNVVIPDVVESPPIPPIVEESSDEDDSDEDDAPPPPPDLSSQNSSSEYSTTDEDSDDLPSGSETGEEEEEPRSNAIEYHQMPRLRHAALEDEVNIHTEITKTSDGVKETCNVERCHRVAVKQGVCMTHLMIMNPKKHRDAKYRKRSVFFGGLAKKARGLVSKKKKRFKKGGFDLDLAYVTPRIIAMGYPSVGKEAAYRNPLNEVQEFFAQIHGNKFRVYNLCAERRYPGSHFKGQVKMFAFQDHNPPPLDLVLPFCEDAHSYLSNAENGEQRVIAPHCKAGKGRTGTLIACYLIFCKHSSSAKSALAFFGEKRTKNGKGVTIPSQIRYVGYFEKFLKKYYWASPQRFLSPGGKRVICERVKLTYIPTIRSGGCAPYLALLGPYTEAFGDLADEEQATKGNKHWKKWAKEANQELWNMKEKLPKIEFYLSKKTESCVFMVMQEVHGDIKFQLWDDDDKEKGKGKMCWFWLNTNFCGLYVSLNKREVDNAVKDKKDHVYHPDFQIEIWFRPVDAAT